MRTANPNQTFFAITLQNLALSADTSTVSEWAESAQDRQDNDRERSQSPYRGVVSRTDLLSELVDALQTPPAGVILIEIDLGQSTDSDERVAEVFAGRIAEQTEPDDITLVTSSRGFALIRSAITSPAEAEGLAFRVHKALTEPIPVDGEKVTCDAAIGVATSLAGDTNGELLHYAEHALGDSKILGGDRVIVFDDEDRELLL